MIPYYAIKSAFNYKGHKKSKGETEIPYFGFSGVKPQMYEGPGTSFTKEKNFNDALHSGDINKIKNTIGNNFTDILSHKHDLQYYKSKNQKDIDKADQQFSSKLLQKEWYNPNALGASVGMTFKNKIGDHVLHKAATTFGEYYTMPQE